MCSNPTTSASEINRQQYEVLACEPLHDITNVVQNSINELPSHIGNKEIAKQHEQFCSQTVGEKNQIKGSDYMKLDWQSSHKPCIKRAKFTQTMYQEGKVHTTHTSRGQS